MSGRRASIVEAMLKPKVLLTRLGITRIRKMTTRVPELLAACSIEPTEEIGQALKLLERLSSVRPTLEANRSNADFAIRVGMELLEVARNNTHLALAQSIATQVLSTGDVDLAMLSELDAAILAGFMGASETLFIPPSSDERRPDLLGVLGGGEYFSMEVTRGRSKARNEQRMNYAARILQQLPASWEVRRNIHVVAPIEGADLAELVRHAGAMPAGVDKQLNGLWRVITHRMEPNTSGIGISPMPDDPPKWWPPSTAVATVLSGPVLIHPREMRYGELSSISVPFDRAGYLNPLRRKIKHRQSIPDVPHIVVVDATSLPDAFHAYRGKVFELISAAPEISAVVLFQHYFYLPESRWGMAMYMNPRAANPVPTSIREKFIGDGTHLTCKVNFARAA